MTHYQWSPVSGGQCGAARQWRVGSSVHLTLDSSMQQSSPPTPHHSSIITTVHSSSHHHYCSPVMAAASFVWTVSPAAASPRSRPGPSGWPGMLLHDTPLLWSHHALITPRQVSLLSSPHTPASSSHLLSISSQLLVACGQQESGVRRLLDHVDRLFGFKFQFNK